MYLEKNRTYACTFPVQRKEMNVVKVRFTMWYSSRKLSNEKVITTACNFWRQIACFFQVVSGNILFLRKKIFEVPPFFQTRPGDLDKKVHACSLRFSALKSRTGTAYRGGLKTKNPIIHCQRDKTWRPYRWVQSECFVKREDIYLYTFWLLFKFKTKRKI